MAHIGFSFDPYEIEESLGITPSYDDTFQVYIDGQPFSAANCTAPATCPIQKSENNPAIVVFNISNIPAGQLTVKLTRGDGTLLDVDWSLQIVDQEQFTWMDPHTPVFFSLPPGPQCNIIFNEFRSKDLIQTEYDEGPDWIELYNRTPYDIDLSDYYLNIYQGDRNRDDKYRWWNNYYNDDFDSCPNDYIEDGCDNGWHPGDLGSVPYAIRIDVPLPQYPMTFNGGDIMGNANIDSSTGILLESPGDADSDLRKIYGGHWEDDISWNGLVNSNESSCNTHVCIKGRDLSSGEGGRFWLVGNKNSKGIFYAGPKEGLDGDWYDSENIDLTTKLCSSGECTGKDDEGQNITNTTWADWNFNVSNINTYNLSGAFTSYMYYEIPKSTSTRKYTIELWKGNPNKYVCDISDPGTNNYHRPCGLLDSTINGLNHECPKDSQCVLASTILPTPELECSMTYGTADWPTLTGDKTNKSFQLTRTEDENFDTNDINYFYNWSYAQSETEYNSDGYTDDFFDASEKTGFIDWEEDDGEYDDNPEIYNNNTGFVFPDWFESIGFYQDWATGQCMQTNEFGVPVCYNTDQVASPLRKNSRTIIGDIIPACINPNAENYYCYWTNGEYNQTQCQDYWSCDLSNFDYPNINQELCPNGQLPFNIANSLNLCVFPPEPACLDTGNGEFQPEHKTVPSYTSALNAPDDVWICNHNQSTCDGPTSTQCGVDNECVFNQWEYRECMDSWDNSDGTPGGCCEYPAEFKFGLVDVEEIGYGEAAGKTGIQGKFSFPIFSISNLLISSFAGGNYDISQDSGEGNNMITTDGDSYFHNYNFGQSYNFALSSNGGGGTSIYLTDPISIPIQRAPEYTNLFSINWDNDWGIEGYSSYKELLNGSSAYFSNSQAWVIIYQPPIYPDLLTPSYISEVYGESFSPLNIDPGTSQSVDCNGVPTNLDYDFAYSDFCNICAGGTTDNEFNICPGDDLGSGRCSSGWEGPNFDQCGVCDGGLEDLDCNMDCFGTAEDDCAGTCEGDAYVDGFGDCCLDSQRDCAGVCFGTSIYDCFSNCVSSGSSDGCGTGGICNYINDNTTGGGNCECLSGYFGGGSNVCVSCPTCGDNGYCDDYDLSNTGNCICTGGYYGGECGECCDFNCNDVGNCNGNGTCIAPNVCDCLETHNCDSDGDGIYDCGLPICNGVCGDVSCQNGGYCDTDSPGVCTCVDFWIGDNCSTPDCGGTCQNGGVCNGNTGECDCSQTDYCGEFCDTPICAGGCGNENCLNGGSCDSPGDCNCDGTGYCGPTCGSLVCNDTCDYPSSTTDCGIYGTCGDSGTCDCIPNYCGTWCTNYECNGECNDAGSDGCVNGTCQAGGTCSCDTGWGGLACDVIMCNGVENGDCLNGGICDTPGGVCSCPSGWCGDYCEYPICDGVCGGGTQNDGCLYGTCVGPDDCSCNSNLNTVGSFECVDSHGGNGELRFYNPTNNNNCNSSEDFYNGNCPDVTTWNGSTRLCDASNGAYSAGYFYAAECYNSEYDITQFVLLQAPDIEPNSLVGNIQCAELALPGYCGEWCQWPVCDNECNNDCGYGECNNPGMCDCGATGYCGNNCDVPICNGYCEETDSNGFNGCLNDGNCTIAGCECTDNYCGNDCSGILSGGNCPDQCQNGTPVAGEDCSCTSGYCGSNCEFFICNGDCADDGSSIGTCLNGGSCTSANGMCTCVGNWDGNYCELSVCGGTTSSDTNGTNIYCVNGYCNTSGTGACVCDDGWGGTQCDVPSGDCNTDCNNGSCTSDPDICDCATDYYKDYNGTTTGDNVNCDYVLCNGEIVNISTGLNVDGQSPCENSGTCTSTAGCSCINNWTGDSCDIPICNGVDGGNCVNGSCDTPGACVCDSGWCGAACDTPECAGGCGTANCQNGGTCPDSNAGGGCNCDGTGYTGDACESIVCNGVPGGDCVNGDCVVAGTTCTCNTGWCGDYCDIPICNGFCGATSDGGFDGCVNGTCTGNGCDCDTDWCGSSCNTPVCNGVCGGGCNNGTCTVDGCSCNTGWSGNDCTIPICNGVENGDCLNGGTCDTPNPTCDCTGTDHCGNYCETPICYGNCGDLGCTNGTCDGVDTCNCTDTGYCGTTCQTPECAGGCGDENCVNGGTCNFPGDCSCPSGWCGSTCGTPVCGGVCGGGCVNGDCVSSNTCSCDDGWAGLLCDIPICNGVENGDCVNGGTCNTPGTCVCPAGYFGDDCSGVCNCNGGTCDDYLAGNTGNCLDCPDLYYGDNCETIASCVNGICGDTDDSSGNCHGIDGTGECDECNEGWAGVNCNIECPGGANNQCNGNGICSDGTINDGTCECDVNWNCNDSCSVEKDCHDVCGGSNLLDDCGVCACYGSNCGGNTHIPNSDKDCNGVCPDDFGDSPAFIDDCGCCVGGNTGKEASYLSGSGECTIGDYMDECCLCNYSDVESCNPSLASNGALAVINQLDNTTGTYNGVTTYPGYWTYGNSKDCTQQICFGPNTNISGNWGNHCCCETNISDQCQGILQDCGCFEQNCDDCNGIPYGNANIDSCNICSGGSTQQEVHIGNCIPNGYTPSQTINENICAGDDECNVSSYCFVSSDDVTDNPRLNDACGVCGGDNSTCNIQLSFGEIDLDNQKINVFINNSNSRANYISEIRLPIYTNGNAIVSGIDYNDGGLASTILGDTIALFSMTEPEMYVFDGTEEGFISNVTMNFGQTELYLPPTSGTELLFTLNWNKIEDINGDVYFHLFDPYSNSNDVEIDTFQPNPYNGSPLPLQVLSHSSITSAEDSIISLSENINAVYGCMDPYAINCDSESCGCNPLSKYCVNVHNQDSCQYPTLSFSNVSFDGTIVESGIEINPLTGINTGYLNSDFLYTFSYENFESSFGYGNIQSDDLFVDVILFDSSGNVIESTSSVSLDSGAYADNVFSDGLWDLANNLPVDGSYIVRLEWPSGHENIIDPIESGTFPRIKSEFEFSISKSGCRRQYNVPIGQGNLTDPTGYVFTTNNDSISIGLTDDGAIESGYNLWASSDCVGVIGGTNYSCCLYEDFYGTSCKWEDKDDCYICSGSGLHDVSYYWYQDQDYDGIPCSTGYITGICPYLNPITNYGQSGNWIQGGESDHGDLPEPESGDACTCASPASVLDSCGICVPTSNDDNSDTCGLCPPVIGDGVSQIDVTYDDGYSEILYYVAPNSPSSEDCAGVCPTSSPICDIDNLNYTDGACDGYGAYKDGCGVCSGGISVDPITMQIPHQAHTNLDNCGVCHTELSENGYIPGSGEWGTITNQSSTWSSTCSSCDQSSLQVSEYSCDFNSNWPADDQWNIATLNPICCIASGGRIKWESPPDGEAVAICDGGNGIIVDNQIKPYYDDCGICTSSIEEVNHPNPNVGTCWNLLGDWPSNLDKQEIRDICKNNPSTCVSVGTNCSQSFSGGVYADTCNFDNEFCFVDGPDSGCSGQCGRLDVIDMVDLNSPHCCCNDACGDWYPSNWDVYYTKPSYVYGLHQNDFRLYYPDLDTSYCSHDRTKLCTLMDVIDCDGDYCDACDMQGTCVLGSQVYSYCSQSQAECSLLQGMVNDGSPCSLGDGDVCTIYATGETVLFDDDIEAPGDPTIPLNVCSSQNRTIRYDNQTQDGYPPGTEFLYTWITDNCAGWISPELCIVPGTTNYYCFENENDINTILDCNNACPSDTVGSVTNPCSTYGNYDQLCILYGPECKPSCHVESDYEGGCFNGPVCSVDSSTPCWSNIPGINDLGLLVGGPGHYDVTLCPDYISPTEQGMGCSIPEELPMTVANGQIDTNVCDFTDAGNKMYPTNIGNPGDDNDNAWDSSCKVCADDEAINTYIDTIVYVDNSLCLYALPSPIVNPIDLNEDGFISDTDYYPLSTFDDAGDDTPVPVHSTFIVSTDNDLILTNPITMEFKYEGPYEEIIITRKIDDVESTIWISNAIEDGLATIINDSAPANGLDDWNYPYGTEWRFVDSFLDENSQSLVSNQLSSFQVEYKISVLNQNDNYIEGDFISYNVLLFSPQLNFLSPINGDVYYCNDNIPIVIDYQNIPIDDSLYMAKLEVWGLPYNNVITEPQLLDYSNYQIDLWTDENYYNFNGNGTQLQSEDCTEPCDPGNNFWYCTKPIDSDGDGFPDWGNWTATLPNEGTITFGNTLETIIPNYQFKFQEDCNFVCDVDCTTEHHLVFPTNGNIGTGVINIWEEDVWRTGEVSLYIKYPQDGPNQSVYDTVSFNVNVSQGCGHSPTLSDDGTYGGACTCDSCYSLCPNGCDAMINQSDGWETTMQQCYDMGFYNPNSCTGICDNPDDATHGNLCHNDQDCNIGADYYENPIYGEYSKYRGCTRFAKTDEQINNASGACIYPSYGCTDDGEKLGGICDGNSTNSNESCGDFFDCPPNSGEVLGQCEVQSGTYINNQYGYGSVIPGVAAINCETLSCNNCQSVSYIVGNTDNYLECATTEYPNQSSCNYSACNDVQALTYWANYPEFAVGPNPQYNYDECNGERNIEGCGVGDENYWVTGTNEDGEDLCLYEFQFRLLYQVRSTKHCLDATSEFTFNCSGNTSECPNGRDDECPGDETCLLPSQCDIDLDCPGNEVCYSGDLTPIEFGEIPLDKYSNYDSNNIKDIIRITKPKIFDHGGPGLFDMVFWIEGNSEMNSNYPWLPSVGEADDTLLVDYQNETENPWAIYNWQFDEELSDTCTTEDEICEGPSISLSNETFLEPNNDLNQMSYVYEADANGYRYGMSNGNFGSPIDQSDTNIAIKVKLDYPNDPDPDDAISTSAERIIYISLVRNDYIPRVILDNDTDNDGISTISELNPILDVIDTEPMEYNFSVEEFNYDNQSYYESIPSDTILTGVEVSPSFGLSAVFSGYTDNVGTILLGPPAVRGMWSVFVRLTQQPIIHPIYKDVIRPMIVTTPATFTVQALNTEGPSGSVLGVTVSSFGISPDTWQFKVIGDDKRRYLEFPDPTLPPAVPEVLESYEIPLKLGYITQTRASGVCSNDVMNLIWTYSNYICNDGSGDFDNECNDKISPCNSGNNECIGEPGSEIQVPTEFPLQCNYGSNYYFNGTQNIEMSANDYCAYVGDMQGNPESECVGDFGGDVSQNSMAYKCNVNVESIDLVQGSFQGLPDSGHDIVDKLIMIEDQTGQTYNGYNNYDFYDGDAFINLEYQAPIVIWDNEQWPSNYQCWIPNDVPLSDGENYYQEYQEAVPGGSLSYPNPNLGGWTTQNMETGENPYGDSKDTVWMYELQFFKCLNEDCNRDEGVCTSNPSMDNNFDSCFYYEGIDSWEASGAEFIHSRTFKDWWSPDDNGRSLLPVYGDTCEFGDFEPDQPGICDIGYESSLMYEDMGNVSSDIQVNTYNGYVNQDGVDPSMGYNRIYDLINRGYKFRFLEDGTYKVRVKAYDLYYNTATVPGSADMDVVIDYIIPIEQTLPNFYLPYQGLNIPLESGYDYENDYDRDMQTITINEYDVDDRPILGCFYQDDMNWDGEYWIGLVRNEYTTDDDRFSKWYNPIFVCELDSSIQCYGTDDETTCSDLDSSRCIYNDLLDESQKENSPEFTVDVDVRVRAADSIKTTTLFSYWDPEIHPTEYEETTGPATVQFYFYQRHAEGTRCDELSSNANESCGGDTDCENGSCVDNKVLSPREILLMEEPDPRDAEYGILEYQTLLFDNLNEYYITRVNWGDGSQEFWNEPYKLSNSMILTHDYDKPGIYEVTGYMFSLRTHIEAEVADGDIIQQGDEGVRQFQKFKAVFSLNKSKDNIYDFPQLGGLEYTYIPQGDSLNNENIIVGGISANSLYAKTLKRRIGYSSAITTPEEPQIFDVKWPFYQDKLDAEYALAQVDQRLIGKDISRFTGSNAASSSQYINEDTSIIDWDGDIVEASRAHGYFSGSVDPITGEILGTPTPEIIHRGSYKYYGNLGDHIGDADLGQVRLINKPMEMYEMLGFDSYTLQLSGHPEEVWLEDQQNDQEIYHKNTYVWESDTVSLDDIVLHENIHIIYGQNVSAMYNEELGGWLGTISELVTGISYTFVSYNDVGSYTWDTGRPSPAAIPSSEKYWKNIIPSDYELSDRSGVFSEGESLPYFICEGNPSISCTGLDDIESCEHLSDDNLSTVCVSADICQNQICVDENNPQYWDGTNIYNKEYYYPVLPKVTRYRTFDKYQIQNDNSTFFGTKMRWNANDKIAPITNNDFYDYIDVHENKLMIDLNFNDTGIESILDRVGGGYLGIFTGDYKIEFSEDYKEQEKQNWIGLPTNDITDEGGKQF